MSPGSVFHRVGASTEKARVPAFVFTLGTASKFELDDRSCYCCLAGANIESKCEGSLAKRGWYVIVHALDMMRNCTGSRTEREKRGDLETTLAKQFWTC